MPNLVAQRRTAWKPVEVKETQTDAYSVRLT